MSRILSNLSIPGVTNPLTRGTLLVGSKSLTTYSFVVPETGPKADISWWNQASEMDLTNSLPLQAEAISACWSSESSFLAILDVQHTISLYRQDGDSYILWDQWDKRRLQENIQAIRFAPRSGRLWMGGSAGVLRCLDCNSHEFVDQIEQEHHSPITEISVNSDESFLASLDTQNVLFLHNLMKNTSTKLIHDASERLVHLEFSVKRSHLVGAGDDGHLYFWNTQELPRTVYVERSVHCAPVTGLRFSPFNHMMLCSIGLDKKIFVFDVERRRPVRTWTAPAPLTTLACTAESPIFLVGTNQGVIFAYKLDLKEPIKTTQIEGDRVKCILYQPGISVKTTPIKRNPGIARITGNSTRSNILGINPLDSPLFNSPSVDFASLSLLHDSRLRKGPTLPGAEDLDSTIDESRFQTKPTYRLDESTSPEAHRLALDSTIGYSPVRGRSHIEPPISPSMTTPLSTRINGPRHRARPKSMIVPGSSFITDSSNRDGEEARQRRVAVAGGSTTPTNISRHTDALCSTPIGSLNSPRAIDGNTSNGFNSTYSPTKMLMAHTSDSTGKYSSTHNISKGVLKQTSHVSLRAHSNAHNETSETSSRINDSLLHRGFNEAAGLLTENQVRVVQQVVQGCLQEYLTEAQTSIREEIKTMQLEMVRQMFIHQEEMREDWLQIQVDHTRKMEEELKRLREENNRLKGLY